MTKLYKIKGPEVRDQNMKEFRECLREVFIPRRQQMIMYPEGGFPNHLRKVNDAFAAKYNLPKLKHAVLPRAGALKNILDVLVPKDGEPHLDYIVDITLAHEKVWHDLLVTVGFRTRNRSGFLYRIYPIADVSVNVMLAISS